MNTNFDFFDPKNNPFLNNSFGKPLGDTKWLSDSGKILEGQTRAFQVVNEVGREYVEYLRQVASKQGELFADISKKAAELTQDYPYSKDPQEQVGYQMAAVFEVQERVVKALEDSQVALDGATSRIKKLVAGYSKEVMDETKETADGFVKKSAKVSEKADKKPVV